MISPLKMAQDQPAAPGEAPFYIPATGAASRPRRTLKHNDTFAVFDSHGDIGAAAGGPDGLFDRDTRYLSHLELLLNGAQPLLLGSAIRDDNLSYHIDLTNADVYENDRIVLLKDTVHIARTIYLSDGSLRERIALSNHGAAGGAADAVPRVRQRLRRHFRGARHPPQAAGAGLEPRAAAPARSCSPTAAWTRAVRETALSFEPAPTVQTGEHRHLFAAGSRPAPSARSSSPFRAAACCRNRPSPSSRASPPCIASAEPQRATMAAVETSNSVLNEILCRSMADLCMLTTATPRRPLPLRRHPLVFDELRSRRHHHCPADAVDGSRRLPPAC